MTEQELIEIEARCNAATPGPWTLMPEMCGPDGQGVYEESGLGIICEVGDPYPRGDNHPQENMEFIAAARADVPALLAEVRRLRALVGEPARLSGGRIAQNGGRAMERVSDEWLARRIVAFDEMRCGDSELHVSSRYAQAMLDALRELQERRAADTMRPEWHHTDEPDDAEQAAPDAEQKPSFVGVDLASGPDRTEVRVIRLRKRPRWLRELLSDWERRACDLVAQGRTFDAADLRAGAEEVRRAHDKRRQAAPEPRLAKWERQLREMGGTVEYNRDTGQYEAAGEGVKWYCADTAKAAVEAAWKAWKEARAHA